VSWSLGLFWRVGEACEAAVSSADVVPPHGTSHSAIIILQIVGAR
jgi:hypothetical protein